MGKSVSPLETCCKLVDSEINRLGRHQIRSNSLHRFKINSRTVWVAATKLVARAKALSLPLETYISHAVGAADLVSRTGLSISTLANDRIHKQVVKRDSYYYRTRQASKPTMQGTVRETDSGTKKSVITSIRIVMEALHQHTEQDLVPLLVAMRTVLDPVLLYTVDDIQKMVDHDALVLLGVTRTELRERLDLVKYTPSITNTPEWRWWAAHVPMNERRKRIAEE